MTAPLLLILGPFLPALVLWLLPRRLQGVLGALAVVVLALILSLLTPATADGWRAGVEASLFGQQLLLTEATYTTLSFVYLGAGLLFLMSAFWPQGKTFVPAGLAALAPLSLSLLLQPITSGIVALLAAAALVSVMIQAERPGSTLASFRYLALVVLAAPFFLLAGWMMESNQAIFFSTIWRLLVVGSAILLGGVPFHIWVRPVVTEATPLVVPYLFGLVQMVVVTFLFTLLLQQPVLQENTQFLPVLRWVAGLTLVLSALLSLTVWHASRLLGYLLLANLGATILAVTFAQAGAATAISLVLSRFVSLLVASLGLILLAPHFASLDLQQSRGLARRSPWGAALFVYGLASLAGLPLTPGFAPFWAAISLAASHSYTLALPLLLVAGAGAVALLRILPLFFDNALEEPAEAPTDTAFVGAISAVLLVGAMLLALFPQLLLAFSSTVATTFL